MFFFLREVVPEKYAPRNAVGLPRPDRLQSLPFGFQQRNQTPGQP